MRHTKHTIVFACILLSLLSAASHATTRYVAAGGSGDGSSWASPLGNIQTAINASSSGDEVWLKAYSDSSVYNQTFTLKEGVAVNGGYIGAYNGDTTRDTLESPTYVTTISASGLSGAVVGAGNTISRSTLIEYCTLRDASGTGCGIYMSSASPTISHCRFVNNNAKGIYADINSSPDIENCYITGTNSSGLFWYKGICNNSKIYGNTSSSGGGVGLSVYIRRL